MAEGTKKCIFCAEDIQTAAKICRFCNREQVEEGKKNAEEIFYQGSVLHRTFIGEHIVYGLLVIAGVVGMLYSLGIPDFGGTALLYAGLALAAFGALSSLVRVIKTASIRWKISNQRIETERGILSKKIEVVELFRVEDISYSQSIFERILNEAKITIISMDKTTPKLVIAGLTGHRELYEKLRAAVDKRRRESRVLAVEGDHLHN
jgi:uncharacterized membrane protein YdbT with pleckstrin-like domain